MLEDVIQLHRAGRLDEAERGYRELLAGHADDAEVLHLLGILRGQRGDPVEALQLVQRAAGLDPDNATCQHTLGEMYFTRERLEEAGRAYERARVLNPNLSAAHVGLGRVALARGDLDAADEHFKVALRADDNDAYALAGRGNVARLRGDSPRALQWLTRAAELAVDDPVVQASYAQAMLDEGLLDFAAKALENALTVRPGYALAQALLADVHVRKGDVDAALPVLQSLLTRGEQVATARTGLGDIAFAQGNIAQAIVEYGAALGAQPGLQRAAVRRAEALTRAGSATQAIDELRAYVAQHPDAVHAHTGLAHLLALAGRHAEALAEWDALEARWPDNIDLTAQHALAFARAGRTAEALAKADRAASSKRPAIAILRARGALLAGDAAAALRRLQAIDTAGFEGKPPRLLRRRQTLLGLAYDRLEQWSDAVAAFSQAQLKVSAAASSLPPLDAAAWGTLQALAAAPEAHEVHGRAPVLLCGLPGSGAARVAALLSDQAGVFVRRDRFATTPDFVSATFDPSLLQPLDAARLAQLASRYRRAAGHTAAPDGALVIDWIPVLDARVLPALKRALPGLRLLVVRRAPDDELLNWLAFDGPAALPMGDPVEGARWLRRAAAHLALAAQLLPALVIDADALLAPDRPPARAELAAFLGLGTIADGPLIAPPPGGLPTQFPAGHAQHYRAALADAFAVLQADAHVA